MVVTSSFVGRESLTALRTFLGSLRIATSEERSPVEHCVISYAMVPSFPRAASRKLANSISGEADSLLCRTGFLGIVD